jgi:hypothetical protein
MLEVNVRLYPLAVILTHFDSCQHEGELKGVQSIYKPPMVLALQLQRFNQDADTTKINKFIKFEEKLDIKRIITATEKDQTSAVYQLYAMIVHTGQTINDGHYMTYVKSSNGVWYCMDNDTVQVVSVKRLLEEKPYMLFYSIPAKAIKRESKKPRKLETSIPELDKGEELETKDEESDNDEEEIALPSVDQEEDAEEKALELAKLQKAIEEASSKEKVENAAAIVVDHNENMKSKREKLGALIEKENLQSKSAEVKGALLTKIPTNQFQDEIDTWDEDVGASVEKRNQVLKQFKPKRKRVDVYDLDYDRGKVKKIKNKQDDKFNKPNMFQITAEMNNSKKNKKNKKK